MSLYKSARREIDSMNENNIMESNARVKETPNRGASAVQDLNEPAGVPVNMAVRRALLRVRTTPNRRFCNRCCHGNRTGLNFVWGFRKRGISPISFVPVSGLLNVSLWKKFIPVYVFSSGTSIVASLRILCHLSCQIFNYLTATDLVFFLNSNTLLLISKQRLLKIQYNIFLLLFSLQTL